METAAATAGGDSRLALRRAERLARLQETLLQTGQSLHDDGVAATARLLDALRTGDAQLYEKVLWCEMMKKPERSQLWLWHAQALIALDRESEVAEEYRLIGCFEVSAEAMIGRAMHLSRAHWDEAEAQQILSEVERLAPLVKSDQRASLMAARMWLQTAMGRADEALQSLRDSGIAPQSSAALREAFVRAAMASGEPALLREAAAIAFAASGEPALASPLIARVLKRAVEALPRGK